MASDCVGQSARRLGIVGLNTSIKNSVQALSRSCVREKAEQQVPLGRIP